MNINLGLKNITGNTKMKISIIIVSFNTSRILQQCLTALYKNPGSNALEIFVVDNNSADDSVEMVRTNFKQIHLIENKENRGFAAANNQAYRLATGKYILLLNPDAFVKPGAIDTVISFMESHQDCGLCGARLENLDGELDPSARRFPNSIYKLFTLSGLSDKYPSSKVFGRGDFKYFDHNSIMEVDWVPGTFTVYRSEMLKETGLFDERFFIYYEETDLCFTAKKSGWKIYFVPDSKVIHVGGASAKTRKDQTFDTGGSQVLKFRMRSEYLYFRKNFGLMSVIANSGVEIGWHIIRYLLNLRPGNQNLPLKRKGSKTIIQSAVQALGDTKFGKMSPQTPW